MQENKVKNSQAASQALEDGKKLSSYLNTVSHGDYRATIQAILDGCMITNVTLANWRSGKCRIPELHKAKINEIAKQDIF